jgi:hypothetical protein
VTDAGNGAVGDASITIASPANQSVLDRTTTTLIGTSDSPRTPLVVELNGSQLDASFMTDQA